MNYFFRFLFKPILNESFTNKISLINFFAIEILNKKRITELLQILPPLTFVHLKRINGNLILVTNDLTQIDQNLKLKIFEFTNKKEFIIVKVIFILFLFKKKLFFFWFLH